MFCYLRLHYLYQKCISFCMFSPHVAAAAAMLNCRHLVKTSFACSMLIRAWQEVLKSLFVCFYMNINRRYLLSKMFYVPHFKIRTSSKNKNQDREIFPSNEQPCREVRHHPLTCVQSLLIVTVYLILELFFLVCMYGPVACDCADQLCSVSLNPCKLSSAVATTPSLSLAYRTARFRLLLQVSVAVWQQC